MINTIGVKYQTSLRLEMFSKHNLLTFCPNQMSQYSMCVGGDSPSTLCLARRIFHRSGNALLLSSVQSSLELSSNAIVIYYVNTLYVLDYIVLHFIFLQLTLGSGMENWRLTGYTYVP